MKLNDPFEWASGLSLSRNQSETYFFQNEEGSCVFPDLAGQEQKKTKPLT
jgi:hypothetical protein